MLAFFFGYALTSLPLLRAGLALRRGRADRARLGHALASPSMEIVDNAIILLDPGRLGGRARRPALLGHRSAVALVIAGACAFPVNRWLIARGKGHAAVHETGIHGGPPVRVVAWVAAAAGVFGVGGAAGRGALASADYAGPP